MSKLHALKPIVSEETFSPDSEFCKHCALKEHIGASKVDCLMNAIKNKWQTYNVVHYCDDPFAYKFVKLWNSRVGK